MDLQRLKENWDALGKEDALGVILSYPLRRNDWAVGEFLATGEREIAEVLESGRRFGVPWEYRAALDFGCGVGRLTQAMCDHFERCHGVDIAPSMIEAAERLNRHGDRCRYHLNESPSLGLFSDGEFDFVYSNITLQHIEPSYSRRYVAELVRVLRTGGLLAFQLPSERGTLPAPAGREKLPRNAVLAQITVTERELTMPAGERATVTARVRNVGQAPWRAQLGHRHISLGNHWLDSAGAMVRLDDGRTPLPVDVRPGQAVELGLVVTAPEQPGDYLLELDLVQEGVAWFSQRRKLSRRRSRTTRIPVRITSGRDDGAEHAEAVSRPAMEMYGVPRGEVLELLGDRGARVLDVSENDSAGPGWISLRYLATKDAS